MCLQVTLTSQCVCPMLGLLLWWHVFLSVGIHIRLCLVCMKNKMAKLCGSILKLKLFGKPSNWCFHYLMIHLDKTPNKPSETWLRVPICSDVIFLIGEEQAPVLIWISCMNPYILPVKPSHTFVRNSIINLEKATSSPFHFFLILFGRQNKALRSLLFGNQTFVIRLCPVISAR